MILQHFHIPDIDECSERTDRCEQECVNTDGSYYCACRSGYRLSSDGYTCEGEQQCLFIQIQWSLRIKDTLGERLLSFIWRLSSGERFESL